MKTLRYSLKSMRVLKFVAFTLFYCFLFCDNISRATYCNPTCRPTKMSPFHQGVFSVQCGLKSLCTAQSVFEILWRYWRYLIGYIYWVSIGDIYFGDIGETFPIWSPDIVSLEEIPELLYPDFFPF